MFKSRLGDQVYSVATFFCQIGHIVKCSISLLAETRSWTASHSVWLNRVPQCWDRWSGRFCTLLYCCFTAGMYDSGDVELHNVAHSLKSGIGLEQHQTEPDQIRPEQSFYMYIFILYIVYVCCLESWLAANCQDSCDSSPETQGRAFHLFITTQCQFHLTPTLSYTLYIQYMYLYMKHAWHLHNKARVEWRLRFFLLVFSEKQWFTRRDIYRRINNFWKQSFSTFSCPVTTVLGPGCQAVMGICEWHKQYSVSRTWLQLHMDYFETKMQKSLPRLCNLLNF